MVSNYKNCMWPAGSIRIPRHFGTSARLINWNMFILTSGGCYFEGRMANSIVQGDEWIFGSTDLALKGARIEEFCGKSSGLADFENTVNHGSAVIFDADSGLCLSIVSRGVCLIFTKFGSQIFLHLGRNVKEFIQIISFFGDCYWNCTVF